MPNYRRVFVPGGTYFFTVTLAQRRNNDLLTRNIDILRNSVRNVRKKLPFEIVAWVVLPDHMHCIWTLPPGDADYASRWRLIKAGFSRQIAGAVPASPSKQARGERGIWQRRYWEHLIRDERDLAAHLDYIHYNPVRHGHVERVAEWPFSTFHRYVAVGSYPVDWGDVPVEDVRAGEGE